MMLLTWAGVVSEDNQSGEEHYGTTFRQEMHASISHPHPRIYAGSILPPVILNPLLVALPASAPVYVGGERAPAGVPIPREPP